MDDLISRQALMKEFSDFVRESNNSDFAPTPIWNDAVSLVASMPSAERRGRWIYKSELYSYCGHPFYPKICSVCNGVFEYTTNYCPNCGALMMDEVDK